MVRIGAWSGWDQYARTRVASRRGITLRGGTWDTEGAMSRVTHGLGVVTLAVIVAVGTAGYANAAQKGGAPARGGAPAPHGGAPHFSAPHAAPHFSARPSFSGARSFSRPAFHSSARAYSHPSFRGN